MIRQLPIIIAFGLASAVLYASALSGIAIGLLVTYLAQLPLFIVGLSMGTMAVALAGAAGIVALLVIGGTIPGLLFALSTAVPVTILVQLALRVRTWTDGKDYWYPAGNLLRGTSLWCALLLVGAAVGFALFADGIVAAVSAFVGHIAEMINQTTGQNTMPTVMNQLSYLLPGITAWSWMLMATVNGLLAQAIVKRVNRNLRPSMSMGEIDIPLSWASLFGVTVALSYVLNGDLGFLTANLAMILAYPLLFQGLSVIHAALASFGAWTAGYIAFYVMLIFFGWLALAVVALGMAEPVFKLRERLTRPKNT
jgi:uncharacterized protein YybS (DUF2232 family)